MRAAHSAQQLGHVYAMTLHEHDAGILAAFSQIMSWKLLGAPGDCTCVLLPYLGITSSSLFFNMVLYDLLFFPTMALEDRSS